MHRGTIERSDTARRACESNRRLRRSSRFGAAMLVAFIAAASTLRAADGDYDAAWGAGGRLLVDLAPLDDLGVTLAVQRDGKLVLGGHCGTAPGRYGLCAARLRRDGQLDLTFGANETGRTLLVDHPEFASYDSRFGLHGLALQADGRVLMAGTWICGNWSGCRAGLLARLDATGRVVPNPFEPQNSVTFSYHTSQTYNVAQAVVVARDGKIVVAGETNRAGSNPANRDFGIARLNADLSPDESFGNGGARVGAFDLGGDYADGARDVLVLADGSIVACGYARGTDGRLKAAVLKLRADGSADPSFGNGGRTWFEGTASPGNIVINAIALDRRGRVLVAGARQIWDSADHDFFVARLGADGQLDASFGIASVAIDIAAPFTDEAWSLLPQGDGKILVVGSATYDNVPNYTFAVARLNEDGRRDVGFGVGGVIVGTFAPASQSTVRSDIAYSSAIGNGGLLLAGNGRAQGGDIRFGVARLQMDAIFADGYEP
jgi:uncharacterized delta-60 repeat protein